MSKWYAIKTVTVKTLLVEVEDCEDPEGAAMTVATSEGPDFDEAEIEEGPLEGASLESWQRHADEVFALEA